MWDTGAGVVIYPTSQAMLLYQDELQPTLLWLQLVAETVATKIDLLDILSFRTTLVMYPQNSKFDKQDSK